MTSNSVRQGEQLSGETKDTRLGERQRHRLGSSQGTGWPRGLQGLQSQGSSCPAAGECAGGVCASPSPGPRCSRTHLVLCRSLLLYHPPHLPGPRPQPRACLGLLPGPVLQVSVRTLHCSIFPGCVRTCPTTPLPLVVACSGCAGKDTRLPELMPGPRPALRAA